MLKTIMAKLRSLTRTAAPLPPPQPTRVAPPTGAPSAIQQPVEPVVKPSPIPDPAPAPAQSNFFGQAADSALLDKMVRHLRANYNPAMGAAEMAEVIRDVPIWAAERSDLWDQAVSKFHSELGQPQVVSEPIADLPDSEIMALVQSFDHLPSWEELPPSLQENENNRERFYDLAVQHLRPVGDTQEEEVATPENLTGEAFSNPFAQMFYSSYLGTGEDSSVEYLERLQGDDGRRQGAQIERLDEIFARVPEGYRGAAGAEGGRYDPVIGYYVSNKHRGRQALSELGIEAPGRSPSEKAKYLAQNHTDELESDFVARMMDQDEDVFSYTHRLLNPSFDKAIDAPTGGMVGSEGETIDFAQEQAAAAPGLGADEGVSEQETDTLRQGLLQIPEQIETLGDRLRESLQERAANTTSSTSRDKLMEMSYIVDSYTEAARNSLEQMYEKLTTGGITADEIDKMKKHGIIKIMTDTGKAKWVIDPEKGLGQLDFRALAMPSKVFPRMINRLDEELGDPGQTNKIVGKKSDPLDRQKFETDPKYARTVVQNFWMKTQFMLQAVGPELMDMLRENQVDKQTVEGMLSLMNPHPMSSSLSKAILESPDEDRRALLRKQLESRWQNYNAKLEEQKTNPKTKIRAREVPPQMGGEYITPENVDSLSEKQVVKTLFDMQLDNSRRDTADWLTQIKDFGREDSFPGYSEYARRHNLAFMVLRDALLKIAELSSLKTRLRKYASVSHLDSMMLGVQREAEERLNSLWQR